MSTREYPAHEYLVSTRQYPAHEHPVSTPWNTPCEYPLEYPVHEYPVSTPWSTPVRVSCRRKQTNRLAADRRRAP